MAIRQVATAFLNHSLGSRRHLHSRFPVRPSTPRDLLSAPHPSPLPEGEREIASALSPRRSGNGSYAVTSIQTRPGARVSGVPSASVKVSSPWLSVEFQK